MTHCISSCRLPQALNHLCLSVRVRLDFCVTFFHEPVHLSLNQCMDVEHSLHTAVWRITPLLLVWTCYMLASLSDSFVGRDDEQSLLFLANSGFTGVYHVLPKVSSVKLTPSLLNFLKIFFEENLSKFFWICREKSCLVKLVEYWKGSLLKYFHSSWPHFMIVKY